MKCIVLAMLALSSCGLAPMEDHFMPPIETLSPIEDQTPVSVLNQDPNNSVPTID